MLDITGKYANFATVITCVVMLAGGLVVSDRKIRGMESGISEARAMAVAEKVKNEEQDELLAQQQAQYAQLAPMIINIYKRGLIVQGKALVLDVGDEPYAELNSRDPNGPTRLKDFKSLSIINLTHPDMITDEMEIGGSFSNATPGYVMNLSKAAGELLHARPGTWIEVRAEPVFEDK